MNDRANILALFRRWNAGAARYVLGSIAVAYVAAGVAPCAAAASRAAEAPAAVVREDAAAAHAGHSAPDQRAPVAHSHDGHDSHGGMPPARDDGAGQNGKHCPHCPAAAGGAAIAHGGDHSSCAVLEDLTDVAASKGKEAPQPVPPLPVPTAFTLPPPFASPLAPPPLRAAPIPPVPLNIRHCVFLI
jgi:hypothetical protein